MQIEVKSQIHFKLLVSFVSFPDTSLYLVNFLPMAIQVL